MGLGPQSILDRDTLKPLLFVLVSNRSKIREALWFSPAAVPKTTSHPKLVPARVRPCHTTQPKSHYLTVDF